MFARFRQAPHRLQVSIVETRRVDGKVRHEHIASLGSIDMPLAVADRIAFWQRVNERLSKLSNRIDPAKQGKIRGDIHARIPMVMLDEQRALQLENAQADERFWETLRDMNQEKVDGAKALVVTAESIIAVGQTGAAEAAAKAEVAKERVERIRKGEDVPGGLGRSMDYEAILRKAGMTNKDIQHCRDSAALSEDEFKKFTDETVEAYDRMDRARVRKMLRERRRGAPP